MTQFEQHAVFPLMAGLQLGAASERLGLSDQDVPLLVRVYERLIEQPRVVEADLTAFYLDAYRKLLDPLCAQQSSAACRQYDGLRARSRAGLEAIVGRRELADRLLPILRSIARVRSQPKHEIMRFRNGGAARIRLAPDRVARFGRLRELLAVALSEQDLAKLLAGGISHANVNGVQIQAWRPSGALVYATDREPPLAPFLEEEIGGSYPGWKVPLFHGADSASRTLVESSRRLYVVFAVGLGLGAVDSPSERPSLCLREEIAQSVAVQVIGKSPIQGEGKAQGRRQRASGRSSQVSRSRQGSSTATCVVN